MNIDLLDAMRLIKAPPDVDFGGTGWTSSQISGGGFNFLTTGTLTGKLSSIEL
jgi:hypothetical protein